jgi:hypothetical protein
MSLLHIRPAMGHVQSEHVHPGAYQLGKAFGLRRRRANGGDDLGARAKPEILGLIHRADIVTSQGL